MNILRLGIGKKLGLSFAIVIGLLVILATLAYLRVAGLNDTIRLTNEDRYPKIVLVQEIKDELNEQARNMRNLLLMSDAEDLRKEYANIDDSTLAIRDALAKLDARITTAQGKAELKAIEAVRINFVAARTAFLAEARAGGADRAKAMLIKDVRPLQLDYMNKLGALAAFQSQLMKASGDESSAQAGRTEIMIVAIAIGAIVFAVALAMLTTRAIVLPLREAVAVARRVANGDLTAQIHVTSRDETGQMLEALREMNTALLRIVGEVRTGTDTIATASAQIASGNMDLSARTEQQASSLEETASSLEELTSAVKHNTDNARQANQLAVSASDIATQGGAVVARVVTTMGRINESSRKIVDIISVIDGIAFQTNILALNAAVEAARAGEQGRGFAVVASEVRNLAQRSAAAAKEIKHLIDDSVGDVENGTRLVDEAGKTMEVVVNSIRSVADIMSEITAASAEQSAGIEQVNQAISQMDQVTQQNAALVEEAAAAAAAMQEQSARLVDAVSVFKMQAGARDNAPGVSRSHQAIALVATSSSPAKEAARHVPRKPAPARVGRAKVASDSQWEEF
ncbi:MAG: methyl-accepting chemotaxis protein [Pseudomonadota bacterium]